MEREDDDGGWMQESQLRLPGRNHPNVVVQVRARPVRLLQLDIGWKGFRGVCGRMLVSMRGLDQMAMRHTVSELREEDGPSEQGAQEKSGPASPAVLTHDLKLHR